VYGVFNGTAGFIFKRWMWPVAVCDMLWGSFVYGASGLISSYM